MSSLKGDDFFISGLATSHDASQLKGNVVAVDATYYLRLLLERSHEPLIPAVGGPLALEDCIEVDLNKWKANDCTPFFVFDGCPVKGQDELSLELGRTANVGTNAAWELYNNAQAQPAVETFGLHSGAYRLESFYPTLQSILRKRGLHFLVPPFKAVSQIAFFSKVEQMCGAIMGPRELLLYPISDVLIQAIDWDSNKFLAVDKDALKRHLNVDDSILVDALLITGTSFLPPFPAKTQQQAPNTVRDAVNMLRTNGKHVKQVCQAFDDILKSQQPDWFEKYCKARMIVDHFIYIALNGAVEIEAKDTLTEDSHEYLALRLPDELHHYLNTGLIGPRLLSYITHSRITVLPTLDGVSSSEYRQLVTQALMPVRELALGLVVPRLHRGFHFKDIEVRDWFSDPGRTAIIRNSTFRTPSPKVATWGIEEKAVKEQFPSWSLSASASKDRSGSIAFEVSALQAPGFAKATVGKTGSKPKGIDSPHHIVSTVMWRFLHLREYVDDSHELTSWGKALATALSELEPTVKKYPDVTGLHEALLLALELIRLEQLNGKPRQDEGDVDPSLLLLSRSAVLLRLRHEAIGYTGPLRKDMLSFASQVSAVRDADRDLIEAVLVHMFLNNQTERKREPAEYWDISNALPFVNRNYNAAMGVAVRTYLEMDSDEHRDLDKFASLYFPKAKAIREDVEVFCAFFKALVAGIKTLEQQATKDVWVKAQEFLESRTQ
ncbi:hypothetical protein KVR01_006550 [Diaporthe batatas]|uniref:uncharacterized protein n=1 Tax=Diaporthe batatas TaxID=748121 RepID=UPI001D047EDD|nr:uncharacterized protein KVR01_006550 [Diaporthe batatas]KAG8163253.1 hypothetical protein KVR01_006550 [Diaporthe batatas]